MVFIKHRENSVSPHDAEHIRPRLIPTPEISVHEPMSRHHTGVGRVTPALPQNLVVERLLHPVTKTGKVSDRHQLLLMLPQTTIWQPPVK